MNQRMNWLANQSIPLLSVDCSLRKPYRYSTDTRIGGHQRTALSTSNQPNAQTYQFVRQWPNSVNKVQCWQVRNFHEEESMSRVWGSRRFVAAAVKWELGRGDRQQPSNANTEAWETSAQCRGSCPVVIRSGCADSGSLVQIASIAVNAGAQERWRWRWRRREQWRDDHGNKGDNSDDRDVVLIVNIDWMNKCMKEWVTEWMNEWINESINQWMNERMNQ